MLSIIKRFLNDAFERHKIFVNDNYNSKKNAELGVKEYEKYLSEMVDICTKESKHQEDILSELKQYFKSLTNN